MTTNAELEDSIVNVLAGLASSKNYLGASVPVLGSLPQYQPTHMYTMWTPAGPTMMMMPPMSAYNPAAFYGSPAMQAYPQYTSAPMMVPSASLAGPGPIRHDTTAAAGSPHHGKPYSKPQAAKSPASAFSAPKPAFNKAAAKPLARKTPTAAEAARKPAPAAKPEDHAARKCDTCGTRDTPKWRKLPNSTKLMCNACGLHWSKAMAREKKALLAAQAASGKSSLALAEAAPAQKIHKITA